MKSPRNKTIDFTLEKGEAYRARCITPSAACSLEDISDKTICGDSFEMLKYLPKNSVDLLIADPYYNINKQFHGEKFAKKNEEEYSRYIGQWLTLCLPLLKPNASVYVCCDFTSSCAVFRELAERLTVRNRITWQREKGRGAKKNWKNSMEDIWFATVGKDYTFNAEAVMTRRRVIAPYREEGSPKDWWTIGGERFRDTYPSNFWDDISVPYWSMAENTAHPTQKPEKLIAKLILASSNEGDLVLDPFLGSGTTSVVAKKLNRRYIGIEQDPLYCAWAEYRLERAEKEKEIQGYEDGVFWERNTLSQRSKSRKSQS